MTDTPTVGDTWYRYSNSAGGFVLLDTYTVESITPKGVWLVHIYGDRMWVSCSAVRRKAYPDRDRAWNSFKIRAKKAVMWAKLRLHQREALLAHVERATTEEARLGVVSNYNPPSFYSYYDGY
jgi:hypothetical protein